MTASTRGAKPILAGWVEARAQSLHSSYAASLPASFSGSEDLSAEPVVGSCFRMLGTTLGCRCGWLMRGRLGTALAPCTTSFSPITLSFNILRVRFCCYPAIISWDRTDRPRDEHALVAEYPCDVGVGFLHQPQIHGVEQIRIGMVAIERVPRSRNVCGRHSILLSCDDLLALGSGPGPP